MFVVAARIASHLHKATKIAENLSLTAKNAKAVTVRAGEQAAGFAALTDFIQELASSTISLAQAVNSIAINISMRATRLERVKLANCRFKLANHLGQDACFIADIQPFLQKTEATLKALQDEFIELLAKLNQLVEDTHRQIRSASVISTMSKVEASNSGPYKPQLEVISDNIAQAANAIRKELNCAESLLHSAKV
ncbi:chemotaxis protein [Saccharobesus litoralis]|uniref:Chemotaxis protein n=2 Tax=Saccharobesus litoralis TaxID=2172099 RepID=A0A2S0VR46_9ALTE|nr:chemotaxis protein [Saccharobesus litoralis]